MTDLRRVMRTAAAWSFATAPRWFSAIPAVKQRTGDVSFANAMAADEVIKFAAVGGLLATTVNQRHRPNVFARPTGEEVLVAVSTGIGALVLSGVLHRVFNVPMNDEGTQLAIEQSVRTKIGMVLTASVAEEIIHRGFELEEEIELLGSALGLAVNTFAFAAGHVRFFGLQSVLVRLPATLVLPLVYLWRRKLILSMVTHFVLDAPLLLARPGATNDSSSQRDAGAEAQ